MIINKEKKKKKIMIFNYINKLKNFKLTISINIIFFTLIVLFLSLIFFKVKPNIISNNNIKYIEKRKNQQKNIKFIICSSPIHNNYGDDAILMSTKNFLNFYFPENKQIILYLNEISQNKRLINYIINKEDILIINGGGYFGLYEDYVNEYEYIINTFPNNQIIFFPCSIQYTKNKIIYKKYINAYNKHKNITLFTRDNKSHEIAEKIFKNISIYIVPDIVTRFNMSFIKKNEYRNGVLLILRKDELLLTNQDRTYINKLAKKHFKTVFKTDSNNYVLPLGSNHETEVIKFINDISKKKLVITDRLHGMIFSVITGTPCIVFGNNYHKIESSYFTWFNNLEYIIFIKKKDIKKKLEEYIIKFKDLKNYTIYNYKKFNQYYLLIKDILQEKINVNVNV